MSFVYKNDYSETNVYGHVVELLARSSRGVDGIHLDLGCGFGSIAPYVRDTLSRHYVGVDIDSDPLDVLTSQGFETSQLDLADASFDRLQAICAGRRIASVSIIDVLEHLPKAPSLLRAVRRLVSDSGAVLVVSVPNVTHRDVAVRMLFGNFTLTDAGLLDHTHVNHFSSETLSRLLASTGWHEIDQNDVEQPFSDQHFPTGHIGLSERTNLGIFLAGIREKAQSHAYTNQLVRVCLPGPVSEQPIYITSRDQADRPFLSVVIRTQGRRPDCLSEVLLCLTAQTCTDFEVLVVGHKLDLQHQISVERVIEQTPRWMREKVRLIKVDLGSRTVPLNKGFLEASGQYIAVLDDDDLVLGHWVETFSQLAQSSPGKIARAACATQKTQHVSTHSRAAARGMQSISCPYPLKFDVVEHLLDNKSPCMSVAYPRSAIHDLGLRFDEELTTAEDWDFMMRAAGFCGVASSPEVTSIYRLWVNRANSRVHQEDREWRANHRRIKDKMDAQPILLPAGSAARLRSLIEKTSVAGGSGSKSAGMLPTANKDHFLEKHLRAQFQSLVSSTSWRLTRPLRSRGRGRGQPVESLNLDEASAAILHEAIVSIYNSTSWQLSAPVRLLGRLLRK